jgi:hypothetical protein
VPVDTVKCGAMFGYTQETNALNFETCGWPGNVETDLIPLKKLIQELLHRSHFLIPTTPMHSTSKLVDGPEMLKPT